MGRSDSLTSARWVSVAGFLGKRWGSWAHGFYRAPTLTCVTSKPTCGKPAEHVWYMLRQYVHVAASIEKSLLRKTKGVCLIYGDMQIIQIFQLLCYVNADAIVFALILHSSRQPHPQQVSSDRLLLITLSEFPARVEPRWTTAFRIIADQSCVTGCVIWKWTHTICRRAINTALYRYNYSSSKHHHIIVVSDSSNHNSRSIFLTDSVSITCWQRFKNNIK